MVIPITPTREIVSQTQHLDTFRPKHFSDYLLNAMNGYNTHEGYMGKTANGYRLFASESDYLESEGNECI